MHLPWRCFYRFLWHLVLTSLASLLLWCGYVAFTYNRPTPLLTSSDDAVGEADFLECVLPRFPVEILVQKKERVVCGSEADWVSLNNGVLQVNKDAVSKHGEIKCIYYPIGLLDDFTFADSSASDPWFDSYKITSDFSRVSCRAADGSAQETIHSSIVAKEGVQNRPQRLPADSFNLNILMFGFDSVSRLGWMRQLPQTHGYFTNILQGVVLEGYNIVGDGTPQALLPILTGHSEQELPEARRGRKDAQTVDGHPWIWKELQQLGYVTQWGEDGAGFGSFQYRMLGFKDQPVDHYMRPFYLYVHKHRKSFQRYCLGSIPRHVNMLTWIKDLYSAYPTNRKFSFLFHSEMSHGDDQKIHLTDLDLKQFLEYMESSGHLNNTLLIMMADHGPRYSKSRKSVQGKYEERLPYFALRLPPWLFKNYPVISKNLKTNVHRLTTPFDIHETLIDVIHFSGEEKGKISSRGISLLKEVPNERSCAHAEIAPHWCTCLKWNAVSVNDTNVQKAAQFLVNTINGFTHAHRDKCQQLELAEVLNATRYAPNEKVLKFKGSKDYDGRFPDLSDNMAASEILYQLNLVTQQNSAIYEATITHIIQERKFRVNDKEISRINKYGDQPACVMDDLPHLRPYCFCK